MSCGSAKKRYLVIGGTGTLGRTLIARLLQSPENEVVCLSRCELKQKELARDFAQNPHLRFILGDIRDRDLLFSNIFHYDCVFHFAALKHIEVLEEHPEECIKTNIQGTIHIADACIQNKVRHVVFSSTDKAVDPINVYGMSKGIAEKVLLRKNEIQPYTRFSVYRWGNVVGSRGSVIPLFIDSLVKEQKVFVTNPSMTRFFIPIEDAVEFMLSTYSESSRFEVMIPPIKAASVLQVIATLAKLLQISDYKIEYTGIRRGEKLHEALRSYHSSYPLSSENHAVYTSDELETILTPLVKSYWGDCTQAKRLGRVEALK